MRLKIRPVLTLIILNAWGNIAFALTQPTPIPAVNVHSQKNLQNKQDTKMQTTHITREDIKNSPVTDLSDLFAQTQSIVRLTNNSMDNTQTALSIRGFGDNAAANSLILVDGFPLTNASLLAPNFNAIALSDIERIDIWQGSQGSLWGDQAVGGVVNIVTRHPEKFIGNAYAGVGNVNTAFYNGLVGTKFESGGFFKAYGLLNRTDNFREHNRLKNESLYAQGGWDYATGTTRFSVQSNENGVLFPGGLTEEQFAANPHQAITLNNFSHYKTDIAQIFNQQTLSANWLLETRAWYQRVNGDGVISTVYDRQEWEAQLSPRLIGSVWNSKITLGYDGDESDYTFTNALANERARAQQNNIFGQIVIPVIDQVDLTLGAREAWQLNRAEQIIGQPINSTNQVFVTEQGIAYHPSSAWQFYVRRDGNFRFPKANEETWMPSPNQVLQPQTGVSYEAGATYASAKQRSQLNVYQLDLNNEIAYDPTERPALPFGSYSNFKKTVRRGVTLTEFYQITPAISLDGQFNYVNARFASGEDAGNEIPAVPAVTANVGLQYLFLEHWRARYSTLYTGDRYPSLDVENIAKKQAGYRLDTLALQYIQPSYDISFEVANLYNKMYTTYTLFDDASKTYLLYPGSGRSVLLTFKASIE